MNYTQHSNVVWESDGDDGWETNDDTPAPEGEYDPGCLKLLLLGHRKSYSKGHGVKPLL